MKLFTLIDVLEVSQFQRFFFEKLSFAKSISGYLHKCNFLLYSVFLFSKSNAVLSHQNRVEFYELRGIKKKFNEFNIFHQNFKKKCAMAPTLFSNVLVRKGSRLKH